MMTALNWSAVAYDAGVDHGVLYLPGQGGITWNGLVSVTESEVDSTITKTYIDGEARSIVSSVGDFALKVSAFTYPDEFEQFTGFTEIFDNQPRKSFSFCYRTGDEANGQLHLVYNAKAAPSSRSWNTMTDSVEINLFEWDITTVPFDYDGIRPTAHVIIDLNKTWDWVTEALIEALYGTESTDPYLPDLEEIFDMYVEYAIFAVTDYGDGTWKCTGLDSAVFLTSPTEYTISWPTVTILHPTVPYTFEMHSDI